MAGLPHIGLTASPIIRVGVTCDGTEGFTALMGWAKWVALAVCILGLFAAGALMAVQSRRGEGGEHVGKIGMALVGVIVISAAAALVGFLVS